ncbi:hypothetical protein B7C42_08110 [Nocardia cerradoensis]|uniref:Uncharacterized protein n=2 Tax=Nocardia cerradoensis TaxID=85688 RepID=A0A231GTB2_9NOCA|nr:hypothetical protein B7C42_08110 [Nocardia cerradoensis]
MRYTAPSYTPTRMETVGRKRGRAQLAAAGVPGFMPVERVQTHIAGLLELRLPIASIARDAGVTKKTVLNIHHGAYETVRTRIAVPILRVDFHPNERQGNVLAVGAVRRLRALHALGWTWGRIAARTPGVSQTTISQLARSGTDTVLIAWDTWHAIHTAWEELSGTPATEGRFELARQHARKELWAPPLDWEDLDIDDPRVTVTPSGAASGIGLRERADDRRREVARLTGIGLSAEEIAVRLGITKRHVVRYRQETNTRLCVSSFENESVA